MVNFTTENGNDAAQFIISMGKCMFNHWSSVSEVEHLISGFLCTDIYMDEVPSFSIATFLGSMFTYTVTNKICSTTPENHVGSQDLNRLAPDLFHGIFVCS